MKGFFLIDKEKGMTSFDVVREVRRFCGEKKVGHSGTLDPLATGLLVVGVGEGTKLLEYFVGCDKEYLVTARFGFESDTFDAEGQVVAVSDEVFEKENVEVAIKEGFLGEIGQMPPKYSALKVNGKRACDRIRAGEEVELKMRDVKIYSFDIVEFDWPVVVFQVKCSTGTYIRSLIHDLGKELGCGGYVEELRRTYVGHFKVGRSQKLKVLGKNIEQNLISLEKMVKDFLFIEVNNEEYELLRNGGIVLDKKIEQDSLVMAFLQDRLVGVLEAAGKGKGVKIKKLIH